jgi:drug/metabolite transporter (DMT)-like permease
MVAFAANSVLNRIALSGLWIGPASFAVIRLAAGALVLGVLLQRRTGAGDGARPATDWGAVFGLLAYMVGFSFAYLWLDTGIGALILFGGVQMTMFAGALRQGPKPEILQWVGAGLAFTGLVYLLWPGATSPDLAGSVLMIIAALGWGVYSLIGRRVKDPLAATARNFLLALPFAFAVLAGALLLTEAEFVSLQGLVLACISGGVTSGMGYALWYHVLPQLQTSIAAVSQLTVPLIAMLGGWIFLSEPITGAFLVAAVLVSSGVGLSVWAGAQRKV